jgi:hypothetical protein
MDYNDFEMERQAFDSVHTWKGPLLEYDRQALSTLYNEGKDVTPSSPILPACADAEADQQIPGVDPLCNRYDIENDPTHSVITAYQRLSERSLPNDVTLSQAILRVGHDFVTAEAANPPVTADELIDYTKDLIDTLVASIRFYVFSGKASLTGTLLTNIKSLQQFRPDVFAKTPNRYNESKLRLQFLLGLNEFFKLEVLPPAVTEALSTISQLAVQSLGQSPALQAVDATTRSGVLGQTQLTLAQLGTHFVEDTHEGLPAARALILSALRKRVAPYFLGSLAGQHYDFEAMITNLLFNHLINPEASKRERTRAAASLTSFKNRSPMIDQLIKTANTSIEAERNTSQTNGDRENAIDLISILSQKTGNKK